jgi:opacity protein-like surface antigen
MPWFASARLRLKRIEELGSVIHEAAKLIFILGEDMTIKSLAIITILLAASVVANAQNGFPKAEVWGTYNLLVVDTDFSDNRSLNGWGAGFQGNFSGLFGLVAEFGGNYGNSDILVAPPGTGTINVNTSIYTYLLGPRASYRARQYTAFGHFLAGGARLKVQSATNTQFAMAIGGGVDVNLSERFAIRAGQFDYLPINSDLPVSGSSWLHNFRYQAGVVIKF